MKKSVKITLIILALLLAAVTAGGLLLRGWLGRTNYKKDEDVAINRDAWEGMTEGTSPGTDDGAAHAAAREKMTEDAEEESGAQEPPQEPHQTEKEEQLTEEDRAEEDLTETAKEERLTEEDLAGTAKEERLTEEDLAGTAKEERLTEENLAGTANEERRSAQEVTKAAEEDTEAAEEDTEVAEEFTRAAEEHTEAAEEHTEAAEEHAEAAEEHTEAAEEHAEAAEELAEAVEELTEAAEELTEAAEELTESAAEPSSGENASPIASYDISGVTPVTDRQAKNTFTLLVIGGSSPEAADDPAQRTDADAVIIMTINHNMKEALFYSFDTDLYVQIPQIGGARLGNAYAVGGGPLLAETMEANYGLHIDYYASISFKDVARIMQMPEFETMDISKEGLSVVKELVYSLGRLKATEVTSYISELMPYVTHNLDPEALLGIIFQIPRIIPYYGVDGMVPGDYPVREQGGYLVPDAAALSLYLKETFYAGGEAETETEAESEGLSESI